LVSDLSSDVGSYDLILLVVQLNKGEKDQTKQSCH